MKRPKIGLALSGGAVLGFAHLGVIKVLEERGIKIDCVAGTSAGSLVGAFLASGYDWRKMWEIGRGLSWRVLGKMGFPKKGLLDSTNIKRFVDALPEFASKFSQLEGLLLSLKDISELDMPYSAIAVDIENGEEVVFKEGDLGVAVQASCSIPGIFTPAEWKGRTLLDGGLRNFVPVNECRNLGCDFVISVKLLPGLENRRVDNIFQILLSTHDLIVRRIAETSPKGDVEIIPDLTGMNSYDFSQKEELLKRGEDAARRAISEIMKFVEPSVWRKIKKIFNF